MKTKLFFLIFVLSFYIMKSQYLVYDTYEADVLGTLPSGYTIKYNGTGNANQKIVNTVVKNGLQSVQLEGRSSWAAEIYKNCTFPNSVTVEAWMNVDIQANGLTAGIGIGDHSIGSWGTRVSRLEFTNVGGNHVIEFTSYKGSFGPRYTLVTNYQPNTWYHIKIEHNLITKKAQIYIDGNLMTGIYNSQSYTEFNLEPTVTPIHLQLMAGNAGTTRIMFDDVKVYETGMLSTEDSEITKPIIYLSETQQLLYLKNMKTPVEYQLYNTTGNLVRKGKMNNSLDISNLQKGVYIFTATDKTNKSFSKKFLKTK